MYSISYPFDEHYVSDALENAVQIKAAPRSLGDFYGLASANVFVLLLDSAAGAAAPSANTGAGSGRIYPVNAGGYVFRSWHGDGMQFVNGIWVGAYSTIAKAAAGGAPDAGNVMWWELNFRRGSQPNPANFQ